jgi:tetratricopeptide (TPR) repeat protein/predicted Ser/Thr protein kinase
MTDAASPADAAPPPLTAVAEIGPGAVMGRYRLVERIGEGGMGVVFAAHDPELDRTVAVKVLRPGVGGPGSAGEQRLRREGKTMARLTHSNVIRVYDVGVTGDIVFVAMEYVPGATLKDWLAATPHPVDEILEVFAQAGAGLAAAHEAGLVHRDFKPSNVLVSRDGRVLVTDFGLARAASEADGPWTDSDNFSTSPPERTITRAGTIVGTPAYMAPEQHRHRPVDARADQFSFCVSLWRALYGTPPFAGETWRELAEASESGRLADPPPPARVPAHVRTALSRGLAADPDDRFASMRELLFALATDPARRRRRVRAGALLGTLVVCGLVTAWAVGRRDRQLPCGSLPDRFAGVWDAPARRQLHDALVATKLPYAETTFAEVARQLDQRKVAWNEMRHDSCEATHVRNAQSDSMFDLRSACLERRARDISVFVDGMRHISAAALHNAANQAADVGDVTVCGDVSTLARRMPLPDDPKRRQAIATIERELEPIRARVAAGRYTEAEADAARVVDRARAAGYAPLLAEALETAAAVEDALTHLPAAEKLFGEEALAADAGGDDERRFTAELQLSRVVGYESERAADGAPHAQRAQAILARLGDSPRRQAAFDWVLAQQSWWNGRYEEARGQAASSVALLERADPKGPELVRSLHMLAITQQELKDFTGSLASEERARALGEKALGANHPLMGQSWETSGGSLRDLGRYDEAERHLTRGLEVLEASGAPPARIASALQNLGTLDMDRGRFDAAIRSLSRATTVLSAEYGAEHSRVADAEELLASAMSKVGRSAEAEAMFAHTIAVHRKQLGADNPATASAVQELGEHYLRTGQPTRAMAQFAEALRALEASQGRKSALVARPLNRIAQAAIALHQPARAIEAYERALALTGEQDPLRPDVAFELAKLLRASAPPRSAELARHARALYAAEGPSAADDVAKVDTWLAGAGHRR